MSTVQSTRRETQNMKTILKHRKKIQNIDKHSYADTPIEALFYPTKEKETACADKDKLVFNKHKHTMAIIFLIVLSIQECVAKCEGRKRITATADKLLGLLASSNFHPNFFLGGFL